jgi:hypothetical protein
MVTVQGLFRCPPHLPTAAAAATTTTTTNTSNYNMLTKILKEATVIGIFILSQIVKLH